MKNEYEVKGDITFILLKKKDGSIVKTMIDTEDINIVDEFPNTWFDHRGYVSGWTDQGSPTKRRKSWYLHRLIMNSPDDKFVDHINHDTLDNRRKNLRLASIGENNQNLKGARIDNKSSKIRGITWNKRVGKWQVALNKNRKRIHIGYFDDIEIAKKAADESYSKHHPYSLQKYKGIKYSGIAEKEKSKKDKPYKNNNSGIKNVCWSKKSNKWQVAVRKNNKVHYSYHEDLRDAEEKAKELRSTLK